MRRASDEAARPRLLVVALASLCLAYTTLQSMVVPALPVFQRQFDVTPAWATWILTAFVLVSMVSTLLLGVFADRRGHGQVLLPTVAIFGLATFAAIYAPSIEVLIALRAVQGIGGAIFPLSYAIVSRSLPTDRVGGAVGVISAMYGAGAALGLPLAGLLLDTVGWRAMFLVAGLLIAFGALLAVMSLPASPPGPRVPLDGRGVIGLALWPALLLLSLTLPAERGWTSPSSLVLYLSTVAVLLWWLRVEGRAAHPLVELRLLTRRAVALPNIASFATGFGMFGAFVLSLQYATTGSHIDPAAAALVDYGVGASSTEAGLLLTPAAIAMVVSAPATGRAGNTLSYRTLLIIGLVVTAAGCVSLVIVNGSLLGLGLGLLVIGVGAGMSFAAMPAVVLDGVNRRETTGAMAVNVVVRQFGVVTGAQVSAAVLTVHLIPGTDVPHESGYIGVFLAAAVIALGAAWLTKLYLP